jgi:hypothetical protein
VTGSTIAARLAGTIVATMAAARASAAALASVQGSPGATPHGDEEAERAAGDREDRAFGQRLPDDSPAAATERGSNRPLVLPGGPTGDREPGQIRRRNHEHDDDHAHEDGERLRIALAIGGQAGPPVGDLDTRRLHHVGRQRGKRVRYGRL